MPIYKPSELRQFLDQLGTGPKKGLSQNFLIDGNILRKIVATAQVQPGELILEVGPGPGSLTETLLNSGARVVAVEKDEVLAEALKRLTPADADLLEIHCDDIMQFPADEVIGAKLPPGSRAKVIANLPYHLTTPIIAEMVKKNQLFSHLILMVQDEVARRFAAKPGSGEYSSFTVFLNFYCHPKYAFGVSSQCFYPKPKVNSAIVILELKTPPQVADETAFFRLTRTAFEHRRKMMRSSLRELYTPADIETALAEIGHSPQARPEELSLDDFLELFKKLHKAA